VAVVGGIDGDVGDVAVLQLIEEPGVADDGAVDFGDDIQPGAVPGRDLAVEHGQRPRPRVHLVLDPEHGPQVAPAHRHDAHVHVGRLGQHQGASGDAHDAAPRRDSRRQWRPLSRKPRHRTT
jgi:hypothetical protein